MNQEAGQGSGQVDASAADDRRETARTRLDFDHHRPLRLGTRGSALALAQTELVVSRLKTLWRDLPIEVRVVRTEGDLDQASPLTEIGGRGVFTSAIEAAIVRGDIDAAVHSAKDLPSTLDPRTPIVAFPLRDDPRDVLVSRHSAPLDRLPAQPVIGTSSRRRESQLRRLRPDARIVSIRGNIDTRLRKAATPEFDGIVIAAAGLLRLGYGERISETFAVDQFVPSPGQGAIAIQALAGSPAASLLKAIDDPAVSKPLVIERSFLRAAGAGCTYPIGAYAFGAETFQLIAFLAAPDSDRMALTIESLPAGAEEAAAAEIAIRLGEELAGDSSVHFIPNGAAGTPRDLRGARVVVTRPRRQAKGLIDALAARGAKPLPLPTSRIMPVTDTTELDEALAEACAGQFDWVVFTSANAVQVVVERLLAMGREPEAMSAVRVAAVGPATAAAATDHGFDVRVVPVTRDAAALARELCHWLLGTSRVLYPRSAIGRETLQETLRGAGVEVVDVAAYQTLPEQDVDTEVLAQVRRGEADIVTFFSPSSVRNYVALVDPEHNNAARIPAICAGPAIASVARESGLRVVATSEYPSDAAIVDATAGWWREQERPRVLDQPSHFVELAGRSIE